MASWVWTDGTTTIDFESAFGVLPQVDMRRSPEHEPMTGNLVKTRWLITVRGTIRADGADTPTRQADITDKLDTLVNSIRDGTRDRPCSLTYSDNTPTEAWAFDNPNATVNLTTAHGLKQGEHDLPWRSGDWVTNKQYTLNFFADVIECADEPYPGTAGSYGVELAFDHAGLMSMSYGGVLCACDGGDIDPLLEKFFENVILPDAAERWQSAGYEIPEGQQIRYKTLRISELDQSKTCRRWSMEFARPQFAARATRATQLKISASRSTSENGTVLTITGVYGYQSGPSVSSGGYGLSSGGPRPIFGGFGSIGSTGPSTFEDVHEDAENHAGIDREWFYPQRGAGKAYLFHQEDVSFNLEARTITATRHYLLIWRHDSAITRYMEQASIQHSRPGCTDNRVTLKRDAAAAIGAAAGGGTAAGGGGGGGGGQPAGPGGTVPQVPLAYVQTSGYAAHVVTFLIEITAVDDFKDVPDRLAVDFQNVWRVEPDPLGVRTKRVNVHDGEVDGDLREYVTTVTLTYKVRDLAAAGLTGIEVVGFAELAASAAGGATSSVVDQGTLPGHGGFS